jgi:phytoene dehydrogenase-like protein
MGSVPPTPDQQSRARAIAAEVTRLLAACPYALPGTLATRKSQCGRDNCRCHASPPQLHGPYNKWTRKKKGKTITRVLPDDQLADYAPWFANHQRIRELLTELEDISLDITENDPRRRHHGRPA